MSELNLRCHFQMVCSKTEHGEEFTVHEAFSTDKGELYMVSPVPVYIVGDSKEEISELTSMIEKDIELHGVVDVESLQPKFDTYMEHTTLPDIEEVEPEVQDEKNVEEEYLDDDYHDDEGNVLDLVDYMNKKR